MDELLLDGGSSDEGSGLLRNLREKKICKLSDEILGSGCQHKLRRAWLSEDMNQDRSPEKSAFGKEVKNIGRCTGAS